MERHPWLLRLVRDRLDPATATGLALTLALGLVIVGGVLVGVLAYLMRSSDRLADTDRAVGQWGVDNATTWSTDALQLVTQLGGTSFVVVALDRPRARRVLARPEPLDAGLPRRPSSPARSSS